jgi:hypothetical protein
LLPTGPVGFTGGVEVYDVQRKEITTGVGGEVVNRQARGIVPRDGKRGPWL